MPHKFSIVMPVYKTEKYIEKSIKSIINQSYRDVELVLVDDGSPDDSMAIAKKTLLNSSLDYQVVTKGHSGVSAVRNAGIASATGNWIIFLDSDDVLHPESLSILSRHTEGEAPEIIAFDFTKVKEIPEKHQPISEDSDLKHYSASEAAKAFLLREVEFAVTTMALRRSFLEREALKFDETCRFSEDQVFIWEIIAHIKNLTHIQRKLYYYLVREGSIMTSSGIDKILTGYNAISKVSQSASVDESLKKSGFSKDNILPRWVLGTMHSAAKQMDYSNYLKLAQAIKSREHFLAMRNFPDGRVKILSALYCFNKRLFYTVCKYF